MDETYSAEQIDERLGTIEDDWENLGDNKYRIHKPDGGTMTVEDIGYGRYVVLRGFGM